VVLEPFLKGPVKGEKNRERKMNVGINLSPIGPLVFDGENYMLWVV